MTIANDKKIKKRFEVEYALSEEELEEIQYKSLKLIPKNFIKLFYYSKYTCKCHKQHLGIK